MKGVTNAMTIGGTVGDDAHPIKILNGVAVAVNNALVYQDYPSVHNSIEQILPQSITDGESYYPWIIYVKDSNGMVIGGIRIWMKGNGSCNIYASARNQDGTYTDATIVAGV